MLIRSVALSPAAIASVVAAEETSKIAKPEDARTIEASVIQAKDWKEYWTLAPGYLSTGHVTYKPKS